MPRPSSDNANGHLARWAGGGEPQAGHPAPAPGAATAGGSAPLLRAHSAPSGGGCGGDEGDGVGEAMADSALRTRACGARTSPSLEFFGFLMAR